MRKSWREEKDAQVKITIPCSFPFKKKSREIEQNFKKITIKMTYRKVIFVLLFFASELCTVQNHRQNRSKWTMQRSFWFCSLLHLNYAQFKYLWPSDSSKWPWKWPSDSLKMTLEMTLWKVISRVIISAKSIRKICARAIRLAFIWGQNLVSNG